MVIIIHLHNHSMFSVLDGLGSVKNIVARAVEIGAPAVGITDHASISCMPDLFKHAKEAGIKPIVGCEFFYVDKTEEPEKSEHRNHLTVWAKNWNGVLSIMEKLTQANRQFYKRPRLSWAQCLEFRDCVIGSACSFGPMEGDDYLRRAEILVHAYGKDNVFFEVMPFVFKVEGVDTQRRSNLRAIECAEHTGARILATNDCHYIKKEDAYTHEVLLAVQTGATWGDSKRFRFDTNVLYMRDQKEMIAAFMPLEYISRENIAGAIAGAYELVKMIDVKMPEFPVGIPSPYAALSSIENELIFQKRLIDGWMKKIKATPIGENKALSTEYAERLKYEISVIKNRGFVNYFLIVEDIIRWARSQGIMVGPARGSSAGSLVCFLMDITQVDPIVHGLFFERFLNPERIDLPDIDVDFQDDRREEVFKYIQDKYGFDHTAHINTFGQLSVKSAFHDVARVFGINPIQVNVLSKQLEDVESFEKAPDLVKFSKGNPNIVEQTKRLIGTIRQQGCHACGMVVSLRPLSAVSVMEHRKEAEVINWDGKSCEKFGLLKIDVLGLTTLSVLNRAIPLIKKNRGVEIDLNAIPLDDQKTLEAFKGGQTTGVFQFEASGMQSLLRSTGADTFQTITAVTALYRPGSLNSGQTERYVKITRGDEYESYACPQLKPILSPTKGVMVYQEQIMQIFNQLAGFSWAEADKMRKIIGKKLGKDEFEKHREHFKDGCLKNGIEESISTKLFDGMVEFAEYSFNKSHAVAYTIISFWTMYLKVNYPLEFMAAALTHAGTDGGILALVNEAERLGIPVELPDINRSSGVYETDVEDNQVMAPLGAIKGIGDKAVAAILEARAAGVFLSMEDFKSRINKRVVNVRVVEILVRAGCFESLGIREESKDVRERNYAELIPAYNSLPTLQKKGIGIDKPLLDKTLTGANKCGEAADYISILPSMLGAAPSIMVVNNPVKGEMEHLTNDGTKYLLKVMGEMGLSKTMVYYTSPLKCSFQKIAEAPKSCQSKCLDFLKMEIEAVKPRLIICFTANALPFFGDGDAMGKMAGRVVYNKKFGTYVLYAYSPQYAYFGDKQADFVKNIGVLKSIFNPEK